MDILKRFQRYTLKAPTILLTPNAPPAPSKMTEDSEGEYILVDQLIGAIRSGGLIVHCKELQERFDDGVAQQALLRDLTTLGYTDFDQVMKVLREQRDQVVEEREFEVWVEGYKATGEEAKASLIGKATARSFHDAVLKLKTPANKWDYSPATGHWTCWGCKFYDNEAEARAYFG